ncbi:MAG: cell division protein FtsK [Mycobacterium sp.]
MAFPSWSFFGFCPRWWCAVIWVLLVVVGVVLLVWSGVRDYEREQRAAVEEAEFGVDAWPAVQLCRDSTWWTNTMVALGMDRRLMQLGRESPLPVEVEHIPELLCSAPKAFGVLLTVATAPGQSVTTWRSVEVGLAAALGVAKVVAKEPAPGLRNVICLEIRTRDPLSRLLQLDSVLPPILPELSVPLGVDEDASWVRMPVSNRSGIVVGGLPGSGKSAFVTQWMGSWLASPALQLLLIDGKGGHDLAPLTPRAYRYLTGDDSANLMLVRDALRDVQTVMVERLRHGPSLFQGASNFWTTGPSERSPLVVVVIDECQFYLDSRSLTSKDDKATGLEIESITKDLVKRGRSAGVLVVLSTQKPTSDAIPTSIRDVCELRVCFSVRTREAATAVLGDWDSSNDVSPIGLPTGIAVTDVCGSMVRFRAPYVDEALVAEHVATFAHFTVDPLDLLASALATEPGSPD